MRDALLTTAATLPPPPDFSTLPAHVDRRGAAKIVARFYFPVSPRSLEHWPLAGRLVNGKRVFPTADVLAHARRVFDAAPTIRSGTAKAA